jgi:hypothetical protein
MGLLFGVHKAVLLFGRDEPRAGPLTGGEEDVCTYLTVSSKLDTEPRTAAESNFKKTNSTRMPEKNVQ